jgi:hypothetical protein
MSNKILIAGLTVATMSAGSAGCGDRPAPTHAKEQLNYVQDELRTIIRDSRESEDASTRFHLDPSRFHEVSRYSFEVAGSTHIGLTYSEGTDSERAATKLYAAMQRIMIEKATENPEPRLPLYSESTGKQIGTKAVKLHIDNSRSVLVITRPGEISSKFERKGIASSSAITYGPNDDEGRTDSVSFIEEAPHNSIMDNTLSVTTEACQRAVIVMDTNNRYSQAAQETECNTYGIAAAAAFTGYTYRKYARSFASATFPVKGGFLQPFLLPKAEYEQLKRG